MSFASEVKKELLGLTDMQSCCEQAMLFGLFQGAADLIITSQGKKIILKSYLSLAIQKAAQLIKNHQGIETTIKYGDIDHLHQKRYYYLEISGDTDQLIQTYALYPFDIVDMHHPLCRKDCCQNAFVRGMFIAKGSINDPRKNCYHLEITCKNKELADMIALIFKTNEIDAKIRERKEHFVVYVKRSEDISATLALMGATSGVFYFEDSRIVRDISNMANRMTNCDIANVKKSTASCQKQLQAIEWIEQMGLFYQLPLRLQSMAKMRQEYPDATLEELSQFSDNIFGKTLSKSGISHCLRDLMRFYEEHTHKQKKS